MRLDFLIDTSLSSGGIANFSRLIQTDLRKIGIESELLGFSEPSQPVTNGEFSYLERRGIWKRVPTLLFPIFKFRRIDRKVRSSRSEPIIAARQGSALTCLLHRRDFHYFVHQSESATAENNPRKSSGSRIGQFLLQKIDHVLFAQAQTVFIPSSALYEECVARGASPEKIRIAMPRELIHSAPETSRQRDKKAAIEFVWVGRLTQLKNPALAISYIQRLRSAGLDARLRIIGRGELHEQLATLIKESSLEPHISLEGYLPHESVKAAMLESDALLLTSKSESFSLVILEALAAGTKVISTPVGIAPEIAKLSPDLWVTSFDEPVQAEAIARFNEEPFDNSQIERINDWSASHFDTLIKELKERRQRSNMHDC